MSAKKVLLVTDHKGHLHIVPVGNKAFYQSKNKKAPADRQYKFRDEMTEAEAEEFIEKNKGKDPNFSTVSQKDQLLAEKDQEIADLRRQLAEKQGDAGDGETGSESTATAKEQIGKIKAAATAEEVNQLIEGETRKSVLDAATKRLGELA